MEAFLLTVDVFLVYFLIRLVAKVESRQGGECDLGLFAFKEINQNRKTNE